MALFMVIFPILFNFVSDYHLAALTGWARERDYGGCFKQQVAIGTEMHVSLLEM